LRISCFLLAERKRFELLIRYQRIHDFQLPKGENEDLTNGKWCDMMITVERHLETP